MCQPVWGRCPGVGVSVLTVCRCALEVLFVIAAGCVDSVLCIAGTVTGMCDMRKKMQV